MKMQIHYLKWIAILKFTNICGKKPVIHIDEVHAYIDMVRHQYIDNGIGRFVAITKDTNELIGWTGIKFPVVGVRVSPTASGSVESAMIFCAADPAYT